MFVGRINKISQKIINKFPVSYTHLDVYKRQEQGGHLGLMALTTGGQIEAITWNTSQGFSQQDYRDMKADYARQTIALTDVLARLNDERAELANGVKSEHPALVAFTKHQNIDQLSREMCIRDRHKPCSMIPAF